MQTTNKTSQMVIGILLLIFLMVGLYLQWFQLRKNVPTVAEIYQKKPLTFSLAKYKKNEFYV